MALSPSDRELLHEEKLRAVGQLVGGIAHDFNNLLLLITFCSDQLLAQIPAGDASRKTVSSISDAVGRASILTRQLLAFSQRQVMDLKVIDLNKVLLRAEQMYCRLINPDVQLKLNLARDQVAVKIDVDQFETVLLNLVMNAQDAMRNGGQLTIETGNEESTDAVNDDTLSPNTNRRVVLRVTDTGCGMSEEVKSRMFEPYFTTKPPEKGTGLGLAVAHGIVCQMNGAIRVDSNIGMGTTIEIRFPAANMADSSFSPEVSNGDDARGVETILLVEDENELRQFLKTNLETHGYCVLDARHGPAAIAVAIRFGKKIDLLLTDVELPEMSGYAVAEALRADDPDMPTIFMSGYGGPDAVCESSSNKDVFLLKPFRITQLLQKVNEVLRRRGAPGLQRSEVATIAADSR